MPLFEYRSEGPIIVSRIFISHSSRDNTWAVAVRQWLIEQQPDLAQDIFLDIDPEIGIHSGQRWKVALRAAVERCEAVVCLVSRHWLASHECEAEYRAAEYLGKRIYCARIEPLDGVHDITREWQRCDLYGDDPVTEVHIDSDREPVTLRTAGLQQLLTGLRAAGIGADHFPWPPLNDPDRAPYRGWNPFEPVDAAVFFGRDEQVLHAIDELRTMRTGGTKSLFVVIGPSGVGKSSFLRAGMIPRLLRDDRHFVVLDTMRPERDAITGVHGLAATLHSTRRRLGLSSTDLGDIKAALAAQDTALLREWLAEIQDAAGQRLLDAEVAAPTLVLPVDQAEELVAADTSPESTTLLDLLSDLLSAPIGERLSLIVVVTIRTDRYEDLKATPQLTSIDTLIFDDLRPMSPDRFRDVIVGPATRAARHLDIAPDLVDRLRTDCRDGADALPLLSLTLANLYEDYGHSGKITLAHYMATGGLDKVVATKINQILSQDPEARHRELELLRRAFIPGLATFAPDGEHPMRRISRWDDLPDAAKPLLDQFVDLRLLVKDHRRTDDGHDETVVEVALESLLRQWDDLAGWLREEADNLRTADNLERSTTEWNRNNRDPAWLLTGARLLDAETLVERPGFRDRLASARPYLAASRQHEDTRRDNELRTAQAHAAALRKRAQTLIVLTTVAAMVAVTAGFFYFRARDAERRATDLADASLAARLVQDAQYQLTTGLDERRGVLEIIAAHELSPETTTTAVLAVQYQMRNVAKITDIPFNSPDPLSISPDGRWIVTGGGEGAVQVWDTNTGAEPRVLHSTGTHSINAAAISPDGHRIVTSDSSGMFIGDSKGVVRVWDTTTGAEPRVLPGTGTVQVDAVAISADGRWVVTGGDEGVRVWETDSASAVPHPPLGTGPVEAVAISADGRWVVTSGDKGGVQVWDRSSADPAPRPLLGTGLVEAVAISADGRWVVTGGDEGGVRVWDTNADADSVAEPPALPGIGPRPVSAVAISPDGHRIVSSDSAGVVRMWGTVSAEAEPRALPDAGSYTIKEVAMSPDGRFIVADNDDGVRVWGPTDAEPRNFSSGSNEPVTAVAISPDGRWIVTGGAKGGVRVWDTDSASAVPDNLPGTGTSSINAVAISPDGQWIVAGDNDDGVRVWGPTTDAEPRNFSNGSNEPITAVAISPDGRWIVTGDYARKVRVGNTTDAELHVLPDPDPATNPEPSAGVGDGADNGRVEAVAISPDGNYIVTGDDAGRVRVWNTNLSRDTVSLAANGGGYIRTYSLDPRGWSINAVSGIGGFAVLPIPNSKPGMEQLCSKLTTTMSKAEWD
ncbi:hypothetical protein B0T46_11910, partial [Nocardia donostiensis]